jgi:hypothetical protein
MPTKLLSERLKAFESAGLVERHIYRTHPLRAEYLLTEKGRSLAPIMEAIVTWGLAHAVDDGERPVVMQRIRDDVAAVPGGADAMGWHAEWVREQSRTHAKTRAARVRARPARQQRRS